MSTDDAYHELCAYTLTHGDPRFIHQHVVDAWAAQQATAATKPIGLAFALAGLYLHLERGYTGREVQQAHMVLARRSKIHPRFALPAARGERTATDVMAVPAGPARDAAIDDWCASAWSAYADSRDAVIAWLAGHGIR